MALMIDGISIPDTKLAREVTELVRYDGNKQKPAITFGNVNADVLADKDPTFKRGKFCSIIRESAWSA